MRKILFTSVFTIISTFGFCQCPAGNVTLSTQAEVDAFTTNFPGCTQLRGSLNISGADIVDLTSLSVITLLGTDGFGGLYIIGNPLLPNLDGLQNITDINNESVFVENNASLISISGLSGLSGFLNGDQILIKDNPVLASLNGLNNVTHPGVDDVIIWNNDALTDLTGLESLIGADDILIIDNDGLINLNGLSVFELTGSFWLRDNDVLTSLDGMGPGGIIHNIDIENNPMLNNINGFSGYTDDIGANLLIKDNPALMSLEGLDSYVNFDEIIIDNNDLLTNLIGLENLTNASITGSGIIQILNNDQLSNISGLVNVNPNSPMTVEITNNAVLSVCANDFICDYLLNGGTATINNNATGCNSINEVEADCATVCPGGDIILNSQADVDNFVIDYPGCTDLLGDLIIDGNSINNFKGLSGITSIAGDFYVQNTQITDFMGLEFLESVGGQFDVNNNGSLIDLSGLESLTTVFRIWVTNNDSMKTLNGLDALTTIEEEESIIISDNSSLVSIDALSTVTNCPGCFIQIRLNDNLSNLFGLQNIAAEDLFFLQFEDNPNLVVCNLDNICTFLAEGGDHIIENNASGCSSSVEILANCIFSISEVELAAAVQLFPNPVSEKLQIHIPEEITHLKTSLFSITGKLLLSSSEKQLDVSLLSDGIYFIQISTVQGIVMRKILKNSSH